jgi:hypothetical protein
MVRMQIQLTEEQADSIRKRSAKTGLSISELIRRGTESVLREEPSAISRSDRIARAKSVAGRFRSGLYDISENHDRYAAEAFRS